MVLTKTKLFITSLCCSERVRTLIKANVAIAALLAVSLLTTACGQQALPRDNSTNKAGAITANFSYTATKGSKTITLKDLTETADGSDWDAIWLLNDEEITLAKGNKYTLDELDTYYSITLEVTATKGSTDTITKRVRSQSDSGGGVVDNETITPVAAFTWKPVTGTPTVIDFTNTSKISDGSKLTYQWKIDGVTQTNWTNRYDFQKIGVFKVELTVTSSSNVKATTSQDVTTNALGIYLTPSFTLRADNNLGRIYITDNSKVSDGGAVVKTWHLDGVPKVPTSDSNGVYFPVTKAKSYEVKLTMLATRNGSVNTISATDTNLIDITCNLIVPLPNDFSLEYAKAGLVVTLYPILNPDNPAYTKRWLVDDKVVTLSTRNKWTFTEYGKHSITLELSNGQETKTAAVEINIIKPTIDAPNPVAAFSISTDNLTVVLVDKSTIPAGKIDSWVWKVDGRKITLTPAAGNAHGGSYTFASAGTYTITLEVISDRNKVDSTTTTVKVKEAVVTIYPDAKFSYTVSNRTVTFKNESSVSDDSPLTYQWSYNETIMVLTDSSFTFPYDGTFSVKLTATTTAGVSNSYSTSVTVKGTVETPPTPKAAFGFTVDLLKATLNDKSTIDKGSITSRIWSYKLNGESAYTQFTPDETGRYSFPDFGTYAVKLTVKSDKGLENSAENTITMTAPLGMVVSVKDQTAFLSNTNAKLYSWGNGNDSALGDGTDISSPKPKPVTIVTESATRNFIIVSAGELYGLAIDSNGIGFGWGNNIYGKVGSGNIYNTGDRVAAPIDTQFIKTTPLIDISAGTNHSLAVDSDHNLYVWGGNTHKQTIPSREEGFKNFYPLKYTGSGGNSKFVTASAGDRFTLAINEGGQVIAWGKNDSNQCGTNNTSPTAPPEAVNNLSGRFIAVSAGYNHSLALHEDGSVWAWGSNNNGQLGNGNTNTSLNNPVRVNLPSGVKIKKIAAGNTHSMALSTDGKLYIWGSGAEQLGLGGASQSYSPQHLNAFGDARVYSISAGKLMSMAMTVDGDTYVWGSNDYGLGHGSNSSNTPVKVQLY